ncbi:hypothetical protein XENTR_v10009888 [Xenopus tropicalis]|nr:hypothetical protein XENTR_v10009888 [Xenopus tropicalis]
MQNAQNLGFSSNVFSHNLDHCTLTKMLNIIYLCSLVIINTRSCFIITGIGPLIRKPVIQKAPNYRKPVSHRLHYKQIIQNFKTDFLFLCRNKTEPCN